MHINYGKISFSRYTDILKTMVSRFGDPAASDVRDGKYTVYWCECHPVRSDWVYDIRVTVKTGRDFIVEEYCFINR